MGSMRDIMLALAASTSMEDLVDILELAIADYKKAPRSEKRETFEKLCMSATMILTKRIAPDEESMERVRKQMHKFEDESTKLDIPEDPLKDSHFDPEDDEDDFLNNN